jgi:aminoglycoside phosphotransferase (APT) family kinase protein
VLTFLAGEVTARWRRFEDTQVEAAARLLRAMHDASRGLAAEVGRPAEVICHHDPGPNNTVLRAGVPVAFIDFDFAAPGDLLEDIAYLAWSWCISSRPDRGPPAVQAAQVVRLADAYGSTRAQRAALPGSVEARILRNESNWQAVQHHGSAPRQDHAAVGEGTAGSWPLHRAGAGAIARAAEMAEWSRREARFVAAHREVFSDALA